MKINSIQQQVKRTNRYSIFVNGKYAFSLSESALLETKLVSGQEITEQQVKDFKQLSADDKIYGLALRYVALRPRTNWEIEQYLVRKQASPPLSELILNKLSINGFIDDETYARMFVNDRHLLRPASRRKITAELRRKHISGDIIERVLSESNGDEEQAALRSIIAKKRQQTRYRDDLKLMQYLARQGFNYDDIKSALAKSSSS